MVFYSHSSSEHLVIKPPPGDSSGSLSRSRGEEVTLWGVYLQHSLKILSSKDGPCLEVIVVVNAGIYLRVVKLSWGSGTRRPQKARFRAFLLMARERAALVHCSPGPSRWRARCRGAAHACTFFALGPDLHPKQCTAALCLISHGSQCNPADKHIISGANGATQVTKTNEADCFCVKYIGLCSLHKE